MLLHLALAPATSFLAGCGGKSCQKGAASATIGKYIRKDIRIECEKSKAFRVEGRTVQFQFAEYGPSRDCPSGCFYSSICAIRDGDEAFLFSASWNSVEETPVGIREECPDLITPQGAFETYSTGNKYCEPSGLDHPVTRTGAFQKFMREQKRSGPFGVCVDNRVLDNVR